jgi:hypothetical protein
MGKLLLVLLASVGGCGEPTPDSICHCSYDSGVDTGGGSLCSPLTQQGCNADEKCNWIFDQLQPTVGHIGCEFTGTVAVGAPCGARAVGPDPCVKGSECVSGECRQICDVHSGAPRCDADHACVSHRDYFSDGTTVVAGVCEPACNPLTQDLKIGTNRIACGSVNPALPDQGCYGFDEYSCSPTTPTVSTAVGVTLTDRQLPAGNYPNACAPGFMPFMVAATGSMTTLCNGLCAVLETDSTQPGNEVGDPTASAKRPTDAASAPGNGTCDAGKRGSIADGPETCRFLWIYNVDGAGMLKITEYTDTLGVCVARDQYQYDSNNDGMLTPSDKSLPACGTLPRRGPGTPGKFDDAADFFCQTLANSMFTASRPATGSTVYVGETGLESMRVMRDGPTPLVRHIFITD